MSTDLANKREQLANSCEEHNKLMAEREVLSRALGPLQASIKDADMFLIPGCLAPTSSDETWTRFSKSYLERFKAAEELAKKEERLEDVKSEIKSVRNEIATLCNEIGWEF